jgi:hypothetical protein
LSRGQRAGGDLIPWLVSQQFQDAKWLGELGGPLINRRDEDIELMSRSVTHKLKVVVTTRTHPTTFSL